MSGRTRRQRSGSDSPRRSTHAAAVRRAHALGQPVVFTCREIPPPAGVALGVQPAGWRRLGLTYSLGTPPPGISDAVFGTAVRQALDLWAQAVPFKFTEAANGTLTVAGVPARHDDGFDFPPAAPELAHAFGPVTGGGTLDGQVHLNSTKTWADGNSADGDLLTIVLHELGHALGIIGHFDDAHTVMNGRFPPGLIRRVLAQADIDTMRALYAGVLT
jgi:hypothetical protein